MEQNIFKLYSEYRNLYLYQSDIGSALFRPLPYNKCRIAEKICKTYPALSPAIEDNIWEECVIEHSFPSKLQDMDAGIPSTVVRIILAISRPRNLNDVDRDLQIQRDNLVDIRDKIVMKICEAFPAYTPEQVEEMDWQTQMKRLAQAEQVLQTTLSVTPDGTNKINTIDKAVAGVKTKTGADGQSYIDFDAENSAMMGD